MASNHGSRSTPTRPSRGATTSRFTLGTRETPRRTRQSLPARCWWARAAPRRRSPRRRGRGPRTLDLSAAATCRGGTPAEYRFLARAPGATTFKEVRPYALDPDVVYTSAGPGRHEFQVQVRAAGNASDVEASAKATAALGPTCSSAALSARNTGYGFIDAEAVAACSDGATPEFKFFVRPPGATTFGEAGPWSTSPFLDQSTYSASPGRWELKVLVRATGNASDYEATATAAATTDYTCGTATLTATSQPGSPWVELQATAGCSLYTYPEFRFMARPPGATAWTEVQGYGPSAGLGYLTGSAGRYGFRVYVRSTGSHRRLRRLRRRHRARRRDLHVGLAGRVRAGPDAVRLTGAAACTVGPGATPEYRFLARMPGASVFSEVRAYGGDPVIDVPVGVAGRYEFQLQARVSGNPSDYEATARASTLVGATCGSVDPRRLVRRGAVVRPAGCGCGLHRRRVSGVPVPLSPARLRDVRRARRVRAGREARPPRECDRGRPARLPGAGARQGKRLRLRGDGDDGGGGRADLLRGDARRHGVAQTLRVACRERRAASRPAYPEYRYLVRRPGETEFTELRGWNWDPRLGTSADAGARQLRVPGAGARGG